MEGTKKILMKAIENYPNRDTKKVAIPSQQSPLVAGFSNETIFNNSTGFCHCDGGWSDHTCKC